MSENQIKIMLKNVRCSFPDIFKKSVYEGKETSYGCRFILDPDDEQDAQYIKAITKGINSLMNTVLDKKKMPEENKCLRNGDNYDREELEGKLLLSSNSKIRPHVYLPHSNEETAEDMEESKIYSGCYVNALIHLWAHKKTNRVNAQLVGIQFKRDGEAFSAAQISVEEAGEGFDVSDDKAKEDDDFFEEAA